MNKRENYTDDAIVTALKGSAVNRNRMIGWLYDHADYRNIAFRYVRSTNSVRLDKEAYYHDCLLKLVMSVRADKFTGEAPLKAYFGGICRFVWIAELKKKAVPITEIPDTLSNEFGENTTEDYQFIKERKNVIEGLLSKLDEQCRKVISLWAAGYSMKEIAQKTGYKSEGVARKKKHICLTGFVKKIKGNPQLLKLLKPYS